MWERLGGWKRCGRGWVGEMKRDGQKMREQVRDGDATRESHQPIEPADQREAKLPEECRTPCNASKHHCTGTEQESDLDGTSRS